MTYEIWLEEVKNALRSINMPIEDWQSVWPFDFSGEHDKSTEPYAAAMKANRYWWHQQNKSLKQDCRETPNCWLPRDHQGKCQPAYERGDYVKVEFPDETTGIGEWMWIIVDHTDDQKRLVFGVLDNEPVNDYSGKVKLGSQLTASYDNVRDHKKASEFTNSRPYSGTKETRMNAEHMKSLNSGDILVYDDGRPGHSGVKAVVLSNHDNCVIFQFEDRADTTTIKHDEVGWTKYLRRNSRE